MFIPFGFYNPNYIGRARNSIGWKRKVPIFSSLRWLWAIAERVKSNPQAYYIEKRTKAQSLKNTKKKMRVFFYPQPYIVWESMLANKWDMLLSSLCVRLRARYFSGRNMILRPRSRYFPILIIHIGIIEIVHSYDETL